MILLNTPEQINGFRFLSCRGALYLETKGIAKKNMYIASFADTDLKSTKNYALDRRVEIVVVKAAK